MDRMLKEADGRVAQQVNQEWVCNERRKKLMKDLTGALHRVVAENTALCAKDAATEKDNSIALKHASEALVAEQRKRATVERTLELTLQCASARLAAANLLVDESKEQLHQLKEQVQQSSADAKKKLLHIKAGGKRHSTLVLGPANSQEYQCCRCGAALPGPVAPDQPPIRIDLTDTTAAELEQELADTQNRLAAAEQRAEDLHKELYEVAVCDVDTDQIEQVVRQDAEPAPKRVKRLQEGYKRLQAGAVKAQVRVKQEKEEVAEELEVSN
jgi:hypothetical protein